MARALLVVVLTAIVVFLAPAVTAQTSSCDDALPTELAGNYSGMACSPVWNNFVLWYAQDGDNLLRVVLSAEYSSGWMGMGFSKDGMMEGSSAMVGWVGEKGQSHIKQFALNGKAPSLVVADKGFLVSNNGGGHTIIVKQDKIYLAFQLRFSLPLRQQQVLFAFGTAIPVDDRLVEHQAKTSMSFDFTTGEQGGARLAPAVPAASPDLLPQSRLPRLQQYRTTISSSHPRLLRGRRGSHGGSSGSSSSSVDPNVLKRVHGVLNLVAWGVLLPIGVIFARYCRGWDPRFNLHVCIQLMGFILGLAGVLAGLSLYNKIHADVPAHRGIGISVLVLGVLQVLALFKHPNKDSKYRKYWNLCHHWAGRLVLFLAAVNIVVGMEVGGAGNSWKIGYGANLAILLITITTLEVVMRKRWKKNGYPTTTY